MKQLNLPALGLENSKNIMFVGLGGGFDIYSALPLLSAISGYENIILVNSSSFKDVPMRESTDQDYPEGLIKSPAVERVFSVGRHGVEILRSAYQHIANSFNVDTIFGVDGGVDSLMRGDEDRMGTVLEDFLALAALDGVEVEKKIHACVGFGSETEEGLNHYRVLENIAALTKAGHFLGSCSMTEEMDCFRDYQAACELAWSRGRKSHIQTKIISAVRGEFGDTHAYGDVDARLHGPTSNRYFINPLMAIYWFFDMNGVIGRNVMVESLKGSKTFTDGLMLFRKHFATKRSKEIIPL